MIAEYIEAQKKFLKYKSQAIRLGITETYSDNMLLFLDGVISELRSRYGGTECRHSKAIFKKQSNKNGVVYEDTLYEYYAAMIKDTVDQIHKSNGFAYVFSLEQIRDVLKQEKDAVFEYLDDSDCFKVYM